MSRRVAELIVQVVGETGEDDVARAELNHRYALRYPESDRPRPDRRRGSSGSRATFTVQSALRNLEHVGVVRRVWVNAEPRVRVLDWPRLRAIASGDAYLDGGDAP